MKNIIVKILTASGFLFPVALSQAQTDWPKSITASDGTVINIYQPQTEAFVGNTLKSRAAISILEKDSHDPIFGVFWSVDLVETDRDTREVNIESSKVTAIKIPADTGHVEQNFIKTTLESFIPQIMSQISLDEILTSLEDNLEKKQLAHDISNKLPKVIYRTQPSMLVLIDGAPRFKKNKKWGLDVVVNSPFTILQNKDGKFYLYGGGHWYVAPAATGPYDYTQDKVAHNLKKIARELKKLAAKNHDVPDGESPDNFVYNIVVSTAPAELIQSDGNPDLSPIAGTSLLYVKNSDNDIFVDTKTQQYYVLFSGRWYTSKALNENSQWAYVASDQLPEDFAKIPEGSPKDNVLASVAGTDAANEAVEDAHIPQTAKVDRRTAITAVEYDGTPQFKPIEGTHMQYAVNTSSTVIAYHGKYYAVDNGIWFIANSPTGPWVVSNDRPAEMDQIPPNSPVYNAKFVYVYEATPDYVYMGYTPGYLNSFVDGPTVVYGTGYDYDPWEGDYYYPRPWTWGFDMDYNPWYGWGFGLDYGYDWFNDDFGYGYGFGLGLGYGFGFGGGWYGGGWWGGASAYRPAYRNWQGGRFRSNGRGGYYGTNAAIDRNNHIGMRSNNNVYRDRGGVVEREGNGGGNGFTGGNGFRPDGNNIFTDRQGNIYQRGAQGQWQQRVNRGWSPVNSGQMERQRQINVRGQVRAQNFQRASNFSGMRFGGGGHFGGGAHFGGGGGGHFGGGHR